MFVAKIGADSVCATAKVAGEARSARVATIRFIPGKVFEVSRTLAIFKKIAPLQAAGYFSRTALQFAG
jgi:hypothetical protein